MSKFMRLKPYNPRKGYVTQRHCTMGLMFRGGVRPNWYEVDDAVAAELEDHRQNHNDPDSKKLFDVMEQDEKEGIAAQEQHQVLASLGAVGNTVLLPESVKAPKTVDATSKDESGDKQAAKGRAAAIPQARNSRKTKTRGGAVTTDDVKGADDSKGTDGGKG